MYYFLSVFTGVLLAAMIVINGMLSDVYGAYLSNVIIHLVGLISVILLILITRQKLKRPEGKIPLVYYSGGLIGVFTVIFNNIGFAALPVSVIMALGLLGQCTTSLFVDGLGLFAVEKQRFSSKKITGIAVIAIGIVLMMVL